MSPVEKDLALGPVLEKIQKELKSINKTLSSFDERIASLERALGPKTSFDSGNPLIFSKVLMGTLDTIKKYEKEHEHGVVAKDLARLRGVELPTIYDHLSKLEEASLIFWLRGTEIGLKPYNAKFYSVTNRDEGLEDLPVLMDLPDYIVPIAQTIVKNSDKGISKLELLEFVKGLKEQGEEPWNDVPKKNIEPKLDSAIKYLLRRILIRKEQTVDEDYYFPWTQ
ncbi:MAG: hypothetical protein BAJATHORv1_10568 [Candidatus Thorarchaeota archaeon]|nr:MAG: hypothetical protein BAJATHORv1_10568 [Candidatus Thorarchaeota archaeon]